MECKCNKCGMSVKGLACGKCDSELEKGMHTQKDGKNIQVAKCPSGCGMIKSPTCCGEDMECHS
jgi:hypothetical protein